MNFFSCVRMFACVFAASYASAICPRNIYFRFPSCVCLRNISCTLRNIGCVISLRNINFLNPCIFCVISSLLRNVLRRRRRQCRRRRWCRRRRQQCSCSQCLRSRAADSNVFLFRFFPAFFSSHKPPRCRISKNVFCSLEQFVLSSTVKTRSEAGSPCGQWFVLAGAVWFSFSKHVPNTANLRQILHEASLTTPNENFMKNTPNFVWPSWPPHRPSGPWARPSGSRPPPPPPPRPSGPLSSSTWPFRFLDLLLQAAHLSSLLLVPFLDLLQDLLRYLEAEAASPSSFFSFPWSSRIQRRSTSLDTSSPQLSCHWRTQIHRRFCQCSTSPNRRSRSCSTVTAVAISPIEGKPMRLLNQRWKIVPPIRWSRCFMPTPIPRSNSNHMSCQVNQDPIPIICHVKSIKRRTMSRMILKHQALDSSRRSPGSSHWRAWQWAEDEMKMMKMRWRSKTQLQPEKNEGRNSQTATVWSKGWAFHDTWMQCYDTWIHRNRLIYTLLYIVYIKL